jgi:hypothetical protein
VFQALRLLGFAFIGIAIYFAIRFGGTASLGAVLFALDAAFLNTLQAGVQRNIAPWVWTDLFLPVLGAPCWVGPSVIGAVLILIGRFGAAGRG